MRRPEGLDHELLVALEVLGDLRHAGSMSVARGMRLDRAPNRRDTLLERPWDMGRPRRVAERPLELAQDRRHGEGGERIPPFRVEPVDRLEEPEHGDLLQVL